MLHPSGDRVGPVCCRVLRQVECEARGFQFQLEGQWDGYVHLIVRLPESEAGQCRGRHVGDLLGLLCDVSFCMCMRACVCADVAPCRRGGGFAGRGICASVRPCGFQGLDGAHRVLRPTSDAEDRAVRVFGIVVCCVSCLGSPPSLGSGVLTNRAYALATNLPLSGTRIFRSRRASSRTTALASCASTPTPRARSTSSTAVCGRHSRATALRPLVPLRGRRPWSRCRVVRHHTVCGVTGLALSLCAVRMGVGVTRSHTLSCWPKTKTLANNKTLCERCSRRRARMHNAVEY